MSVSHQFHLSIMLFLIVGLKSTVLRWPPVALCA